MKSDGLSGATSIATRTCPASSGVGGDLDETEGVGRAEPIKLQRSQVRIADLLPNNRN